jgi:CHASE2 domain-containing sensor protein
MAAALTLTMILLFLVLRGLPLFRNMENALADLYFRWLPSHAPADSLLLVSFDEATLQSDPTLLVNKADEMGIQLQRVFDAGARGIALDFLLPESWGQSESFARLILNNQERFVLASYIKEDGSLLGTECLRGLVMAALGSEDRAAALFGFLNVPPDPDGRIRRVDLGFNNRKGQMPLSMPVKAYQVLSRKIPTREQVKGPFRLDFSTDWTKFRKISWKDLPSLVDHKPDMLLNKMVFIGGEYEGSQDVHRIPKRPGFPDEISGLLIQALALDTLVQNTNVHQVRGVPALIPLAVLFFIFAAFFLTRRKLIPPGALFFALLLGYIFWAVFSFRQNHQLVLIGTPLVVMLMSLTAGLFIRRRLTFLAKPSA